jgi:hypothetical protein
MMLAALMVNALGTMALYQATSLWVAWLFYCLVCAGAGVAVYGLWQIVQDGMAGERGRHATARVRNLTRSRHPLTRSQSRSHAPLIAVMRTASHDSMGSFPPGE